MRLIVIGLALRMRKRWIKMDMYEFVDKVEKLKGGEKRGFGVKISVKDITNGYSGHLEVENWRYGPLYSFGERNFDLDYWRFKSIWGDNVLTIDRDTLTELLDVLYSEIEYIVKTYDALKLREINEKFYFQF